MAATAANEQGVSPPSFSTCSERLAVIGAEDDQRLILEILQGPGVHGTPVSVAELSEGILNDSFAAAVLTEDALRSIECLDIMAAVQTQLPWADFPIVLICDRHALDADSAIPEKLGNVAIVERPIHPLVLVNAARAALRARARQREAVGFLLQRQDAEEHLRELTTTLENRVRERMRDLRAANQRLVQEVRERQAAEERLRESEELYRYTVELSQQMVWTAAPDGTLISMNRRFYEVTGVPEGVAPHDAWLQVVHPDDAPRLMAHWADARASGQPHYAQFRMRIADGSHRTFTARAAPRRDEEGRIIRWYGFTEDVTEQKRADAARRQAEERYRLAAKATNDAIWDLDLATEHIQWTASETAFFGYRDRDEMTTLSWWEERVHPQDRQRVSRSLKAAIAGDDTHWQETYQFLVADGDYADVFDQGFIIRDEAGEAVRMVGAMSDRTAHRRAEAEVRRIQAELIHVSRLSAMGTMASTLAHEMNQPLTAVSSYIRGSRRLLEHLESSTMEEVRGALAAAESAALRAGHIVKRLRELVARGNVSPRAVRLPKVIEDASLIAFLDERLFGASHRIELDPEAGWVDVDSIQIQQVVINLVRNALQAIEGEPRREITIRTSRISKGTVEVSVADTGGGIPAAVREALFSPFQSTKAEGLGIGLSISRTIIEAHGGKIWAEDAPGGGTIFRFTLARAEAPDEISEAAA
jgi:two-component system sensor kinase FixL